MTLKTQCRDGYCDGTIKVVPDLFFHLYTIHDKKEGMVILCVYGLLLNKEEST